MKRFSWAECKLPGCDNPVKARGLCSRHWRRQYDMGARIKPRLPYSPFGMWLAGRLAARDLSWVYLADACGVSMRTIGYWRTGDRYPSVLNAAALAEVLDVPASDVVDAIVEDARGKEISQNGKDAA